MTDAAIAVAWTLNWPGARSAEQVDGWIRAGEIELTRQDLDEIAHAIEENEGWQLARASAGATGQR
jgi:aryl-alcohol dehydrogenase-like predicted oxidoreductase